MFNQLPIDVLTYIAIIDARDDMGDVLIAQSLQDKLRRVVQIVAN